MEARGSLRAGRLPYWSEERPVAGCFGWVDGACAAWEAGGWVCSRACVDGGRTSRGWVGGGAGVPCAGWGWAVGCLRGHGGVALGVHTVDGRGRRRPRQGRRGRWSVGRWGWLALDLGVCRAGWGGRVVSGVGSRRRSEGCERGVAWSRSSYSAWCVCVVLYGTVRYRAMDVRCGTVQYGVGSKCAV